MWKLLIVVALSCGGDARTPDQTMVQLGYRDYTCEKETDAAFYCTSEGKPAIRCSLRSDRTDFDCRKR